MSEAAAGLPGQLTSVFHLVRRFFGAVKPGAPSNGDEAWARSWLGPGEVELYESMNNPDRRHAIEVARLVEAELSDASDAVMAAALLHDVGKVVCGYRTPARVVATLVWAVVPDERATQWMDRGAPFARLGQYRRHPQLGEHLLADAGADPLTSAWAGDHHRDRAAWRVDVEIGDVLKRCDDD